MFDTTFSKGKATAKKNTYVIFTRCTFLWCFVWSSLPLWIISKIWTIHYKEWNLKEPEFHLHKMLLQGLQRTGQPHASRNRLQPPKRVQARSEELNKAAEIQQHCELFQTTGTITYTGCPLHKHQCDFVDCWDSVCCNWHKLPQASNHKKLTLAKAHFTLHCCSTVLY